LDPKPHSEITARKQQFPFQESIARRQPNQQKKEKKKPKIPRLTTKRLSSKRNYIRKEGEHNLRYIPKRIT
jgi:hypothetical protein